MRCIGIDLAVRPDRTGVAVIDWRPDGGGVATVRTGTDDAEILDLLTDDATDVVGLDVPLGWPDRFVDAVRAHADRRPLPDLDWGDAYAELRLRVTDRWLRTRCGANPMSVSTNLIAAPALRAAWLLARAEQHGVVVDRSGRTGRVVEVYPGAALRVWGLPFSGYKSGPQAQRTQGRIRAAVLDAMGLELVGDVRNDHELDALLCAVIARLSRIRATRPVPEQHSEVAEREGWIHVPLGPLDELP